MDSQRPVRISGRMAQRLAQRLYTPLVGGSNPSSPTIFRYCIIELNSKSS